MLSKLYLLILITIVSSCLNSNNKSLMQNEDSDRNLSTSYSLEAQKNYFSINEVEKKINSLDGNIVSLALNISDNLKSGGDILKHKKDLLKNVYGQLNIFMNMKKSDISDKWKQKAINILLKLENRKELRYQLQGEYYYIQGDYNKALFYYRKCFMENIYKPNYEEALTIYMHIYNIWLKNIFIINNQKNEITPSNSIPLKKENTILEVGSNIHNKRCTINDQINIDFIKSSISMFLLIHSGIINNKTFLSEPMDIFFTSIQDLNVNIIYSYKDKEFLFLFQVLKLLNYKSEYYSKSILANNIYLNFYTYYSKQALYSLLNNQNYNTIEQNFPYRYALMKTIEVLYPKLKELNHNDSRQKFKYLSDFYFFMELEQNNLIRKYSSTEGSIFNFYENYLKYLDLCKSNNKNQKCCLI